MQLEIFCIYCIRGSRLESFCSMLWHRAVNGVWPCGTPLHLWTPSASNVGHPHNKGFFSWRRLHRKTSESSVVLLSNHLLAQGVSKWLSYASFSVYRPRYDSTIQSLKPRIQYPAEKVLHTWGVILIEPGTTRRIGLITNGGMSWFNHCQSKTLWKRTQCYCDQGKYIPSSIP